MNNKNKIYKVVFMKMEIMTSKKIHFNQISSILNKKYLKFGSKNKL